MSENTKLLLTRRQAIDIGKAYPFLLEMLMELAMLWPEDVMELSCLARTWEEDKEIGGSGVHSAGPPWRAVDVRIRTLGPTDKMTQEDQEQANKMADAVNARWIYDPMRPHIEEVISKQHGSGPHIHIQVHPRTMKMDWT